MNWDAVGAVAEILGALAVFLSLVYLATQTRNNTRALRSAAFHQVRESFSAVSLAMVQDPSMVALIQCVTNNDPDITDLEIARYNYLLTTLVRRGESAFFQSSDGALQMETWIGIRETLILPLSTDVGRQWWNTVQSRFTRDYVNELTKALSEMEST